MTTLQTKQPDIFRLFSKLLRNKKLQHAYLLEGLKGTGKKDMALWVAESLFCVNVEDGEEPCGECYQCQRIESHQHPDTIEIIPEGLSIKIDQVRELKKEFSKSGMESKQKVIIIEDAEKMTANAANGLLKFLEEPEGDVTIFLLTSAKQNLLPTIVSRCQVVQFKTQTLDLRLEELEARGISSDQAGLLSKLTQSNMEAERLIEETNLKELTEVIWKWFKFMMKNDGQAFVFVGTTVMPQVSNREEQHLVLDLLLFIYQDLLTLFYKKEGIAFVKYQSELNEYAVQLSSKKIAESLLVILEGKKKLNSNVAAQGVFEDLTLQLLEQ